MLTTEQRLIEIETIMTEKFDAVVAKAFVKNMDDCAIVYGGKPKERSQQEYDFIHTIFILLSYGHVYDAMCEAFVDYVTDEGTEYWEPLRNKYKPKEN